METQPNPILSQHGHFLQGFLQGVNRVMCMGRPKARSGSGPVKLGLGWPGHGQWADSAHYYIRFGLGLRGPGLFVLTDWVGFSPSCPTQSEQLGPCI